MEIIDSEAPVLSCPADSTVEFGSSTSPAATGQATAVDDHDPSPTIGNSDISTGNCPRTITRTWEAEDECGNVSTCVQIITVETSGDQDCDGLGDAVDPCPTRSDCDSDRVGDKSDDCPEVAGTRSNDGCPENEMCSTGSSMASDWVAEIPSSASLLARQVSDRYRVEGELDGTASSAKLRPNLGNGLRLTSRCEIVMETQVQELQGTIAVNVEETQLGGVWSLSLSTSGVSFGYECMGDTETAEPALWSISWMNVRELRLIFDYGHQSVSAYVNGLLVGELPMPRKTGAGDFWVSLDPRTGAVSRFSLDILSLCIGPR